MNSIWFPNAQRTESLDFIFDSIQNDFEQQAALYTELDMNYTQLTGGRFRGRIFSAHLEKTTIHMEYFNLAMEIEVAAPTSKFSFCIALRQTSPVETYGIVGVTDFVSIMPPRGRAVAITPPDSLLLVFTIDSQALLNNAGLIPEVAAWLRALSLRGVVLNAPRLANRMRADIVSGLESSVKSETQEKRAIVDQAIVFSVASALTMEWLANQTLPMLQSTQAYERFHYVRNMLLGDMEIFNGQTDRRFAHLGSKRSIEQAFSDHVFMGPLAYARVVRLHNARRKLLAADRVTESIGDIAAEEGFWDASRFAAYYRKQFGELPSATRQRRTEI